MKKIRVQYRIILEKGSKRLIKYHTANTLGDAWDAAFIMKKGFRPVAVWRCKIRVSKTHKKRIKR